MFFCEKKKHVEGVRTFVSIDGGMGDNIRPALYDAKYSVVSITKPKAECSEIVTIVKRKKRIFLFLFSI